MSISASENCVADVDIRFFFFCFFCIMDVDIRFRKLCCGCQHSFHNFFLFCYHYGCRHSLQKIVLRMSTSVSFFFVLWMSTSVSFFFVLWMSTSASENCVADVNIRFIIFFVFCFADVDIRFRKLCCEC